ncbi:MAG: adenylate/guanylate cyclase domain-containing protein [Anaerolineales bacterium]
MRAAGELVEGERKPVTILFADIVGSTSIAEKLDPEEWREIVAGAHQRVSEAIYRYEGTVAQLLGDGLLAFFGAPITHEDDPIRAVRAGLDLLDSIRAYSSDLAGYVDDFQMRVGINTGTVVIGNIGTDLHKEYLALGDAVNVASRVESAARPGTVFMSEDSARLTGGQFELKSNGRVALRGKTDPVEVFEVTGIRDVSEDHILASGPRSPYVGREAALHRLQAAVVSLCQGHGQIVMVLGEAGIGKTRLFEEVQDRASRDFDLSQEALNGKSLLVDPSAVRWIEGRSLSYGSSLTFWTIGQLVLSDLGLKEGIPEGRIEVALNGRVNVLFSEEAEDVLPFLIHLLGLRQDEKSGHALGPYSGEGLRRKIFAAVSAYFTRVAEEQPTVLVLEDVHWADPSSIQSLENLMGVVDRVPLMILGLSRIERKHGSWQLKLKAETDFAHRYQEINLTRLSEDEATEFVDQLTGVVELPQELRELALDRSEGNPLYLEEVVRHLVDHGMIVREGDASGEIGVPDTLQGILLARIDRLEEDSRRTLQLASVIGRSFLYRVLAAISEAESALDEHLSQLQRADLVRQLARIPELEYIFKHTLTQEAAYNSLLLERRKEFHRRVGEAIEKIYKEQVDEFTGHLAHHWELAGDSANAIKYLIRAGERARGLHAHQEALGYFDRAIELSVEGDDTHYPILLMRAQVLLDLFRGKEAAEDLEKIIDHSMEVDDPKLELEARLGLGRAHYIIALDEPKSESQMKSREYYEAAYVLAKEIPDKSGMIKALVPTVWFQDFWPEYRDQAVANAREATELSLALGDEDLILDSRLAVFYASAPIDRESIGQELRQQLEARQDLTRLNYLLFGLMWSNLRYGNFERVVQCCDQGIEVASQMGVPPVQYPTLRALAQIRLGRFDDARRSLEDEVADEEHRLGQAFKTFGYGDYYHELLDYEQAAKAYQDSIDEAQLISRSWLQDRARSALVRTLVDGASEPGNDIRTILNELHGDRFPVPALARAWAASSEGKLAEAIEHADQAIELSEEYGSRPDVATALLIKARAYLDMRKPELADVAAKEGIELAEELSYKPLLWRLYDANADALAGLDNAESSRALLMKAANVLKELIANISDREQRERFESAQSVAEVLKRTEREPN